MNIAIITPLVPTSVGGVESFTVLLSKILTDAGHTVKRFDPSILNKEYKGLLNMKLLGSYKLAYDLGKAFNRERENFDLLICNGIYSWAVNFPRAIAIAHGNIGHYADSIRKQTPLLRYLKTRYVDLWFHTRCFRNKRLVVVSEQTGRECEEYNHLHDYSVIENCVDTEVFRPLGKGRQLRSTFSLPQEDFLGLFVARPEIRKGIDIVSQISASLGNRHKIVAAVPTRSSELENVIQLVGLPREKMPDLYNACDYFLLPSRHEGCSMALLEALSSGLPVVTTSVGNAGSIARADALLGRFILDTTDPIGFQELIQLLFADKSLRAEVGRRGREYVLKNNSLEVFRRKYLELINDLMASSARTLRRV